MFPDELMAALVIGGAAGVIAVVSPCPSRPTRAIGPPSEATTGSPVASVPRLVGASSSLPTGSRVWVAVPGAVTSAPGLRPTHLSSMVSLPNDTPPGPFRLRVRFEGAVQGQTPFLLFNGMTSARCVRGLATAGKDSVVLNGVGLDSTCPTELVAFASDRAPATSPDPSVAAVLRSGEWRARLRPPDTVVVASWIVSPAADSATLRRRLNNEIGHANGIFEMSGAGIYVRREPGHNRRATSDGWVESANGLGRLLTRGCAVADSIAESGAYRRGVLNLYYVPNIGLDTTAQALGVVCWSWGAHREILFVSYRQAQPLTVGHELSHALGLVTPNVTSGHVGDVGTRFAGYQNNLMRVGVGQPAVLTVGQAYRLQFDSIAWINAPGRRDGAFLRPCQDDAAANAPCPVLGLRNPAEVGAAGFAETPLPAPDTLESLTDWLECHDCWSATLNSVTHWMEQGPDSRQDSVMRIVLEGPGQQRLDQYARSLNALYSQDSAYAERHGDPLPDRAAFVALYLGRYDQMWRTRAALVLGCVVDSSGHVPLRIRSFLESADTSSRLGPEPGVRQSILDALQILGRESACRRLTLR